MNSLKKFQQPSAEWMMSKETATNVEIAVDLKIMNYLGGKGEPPTGHEIERIDDLRRAECEKRGFMNDFMTEFAA